MLSAVGLAFRMRFEQAGADADLDRAIDHLTRAVREASETHAAYAGMLLNCAVAYRIRFDRFGDGADLDQAFRYTQRAVQVTPEGHPERAKYLSALAAIHHALFEQTGSTGHLDQAIRLGREGLEATPLTHARRGLELSDLGGAYRTRFGRTRRLRIWRWPSGTAVRRYRRLRLAIPSARCACPTLLGPTWRSTSRPERRRISAARCGTARRPSRRPG